MSTRAEGLVWRLKIVAIYLLSWRSGQMPKRNYQIIHSTPVLKPSPGGRLVTGGQPGQEMPLHVAQRARQRTEIQPPPVVAPSLPLPPPLMPPTQLLAQLTIAHGASFLPCGHTHFSWQSAHTGAVPPGHTPFSWGTAL